MVKKVKEQNTEEKILQAARKIFIQKGMDGARMQEIADEAGINKALLHYYFRSKEQLFDTIFTQAAGLLFPKVSIIFESDMPLFEKIERFVEAYIDIMLENPYLPMFVLNEMNKNPEAFYKRMKGQLKFPSPDKFLKQIEKEVKKGTIKKISPLQLLMNLVSGTIFPFMAKPMFQMHIGLDEYQFRQFIIQRKTDYARFVLDAIRK